MANADTPIRKRIIDNIPEKGHKRPRIASHNRRLPDPLPRSLILTDVMQRKWTLGKSIGVGSFGEIYLASDGMKKTPGSDARYVVKVESHENGPLFSEMHFYHRVGKPEQITEWMRKKKLSFFGMTKFIGSGSHEHDGKKYRFIVLERLGVDLQKKLEENKVFPVKTVYTIGRRVLDALEYVHSHGYVHADVKASNLLIGYGPGKENEVYMVDFGLACRYVANGQHKELKEDRRKSHDGTIEFTSRDAHIGAHSRRGDLETLGYNMLQWLCGHLPWEDNVKDPEVVSRCKSRYLSDISSLMKICFQKKAPPKGIAEYFSYVADLTFEEEPDYEHCKNIFTASIKSYRFEDDGILVYTTEMQAPRKIMKSPAAETTNHSSSPPREGENIHPIVAENTGSSLIPQRKLRRISSATYSMPSSPEDHLNNLNSKTVLVNPTPAMRQVMKRSLERKHDIKRTHGNKF